MTQDEALQTLGLPEGASADEITTAAKLKKSDIEGKISGAPTDSLKAKFQTMFDKIIEAEQVLTQPSSVRSSSPLSQTKMADLPGAAPMGASTSELTLQVGDKLSHDRYEIKQLIGQGGMGSVYHAYDHTRGEDIAIKVLLPSMIANARAKERFLNEAKLSSRLSHPNITNVFDVQEDGQFTFLTMELLDGQDVRQLMDNRKLSRQQFTETEALHLASMLADALNYAHEHTVHRDIKPENIWITEDGQYKLMDFGIARVMNNTQRTQTGMAMGTAYYMAPEQLSGTTSVDGRADQYALGILLYELLTGNIPTGRFKSLREVRKDLSKKFAAAIDKTLEPDPDDRFVDMAAFKEGLSGGGQGMSMPKVSLPKLKIGGMSKKVGIISAVASIAIIGVLAGTGVLGSAWDAIRPLNGEERLAIKQNALTLQNEVKGAKQQIENIDVALKGKIKEFNSDLKRINREISRSRSKSEKRQLKREKKKIEESLVEAEKKQVFIQTNLSNDKRAFKNATNVTVSDTFIREKDYQQAIKILKPLSEQYKTKMASLNIVDVMMVAVNDLKEAKTKWRKIKPAYVCDNSVFITDKEIIDSKVLGGNRAAHKCKMFSEQLQLAADLSRKGASILQSGDWVRSLRLHTAAKKILPSSKRRFYKRNTYNEKYQYATRYGFPKYLRELVKHNDIELDKYPYYLGRIINGKHKKEFIAKLEGIRHVNADMLKIYSVSRRVSREFRTSNFISTEEDLATYEADATKILKAASSLEKKNIDAGVYFQTLVYMGRFDKKGNSVLDNSKIADGEKSFSIVSKLLANKDYEENKFLLSARGMLYLQQANTNPDQKDSLRKKALSDFNKVKKLQKRKSYNTYLKGLYSYSLPTGAFYQLAVDAESKNNLKSAAENHRMAIVRAYSKQYYGEKGKGENDTALVVVLQKANPESYQWLIKHKDLNKDALNQYLTLLLATMGDDSDKDVNSTDVDEIVKYIKRGDKEGVSAAKEALYAIYKTKEPNGSLKMLSDALGGYQPKKAFKQLQSLMDVSVRYKRNLAATYYIGKGTPKNKAKAVKLYKEIVKQQGEKSNFRDFRKIAGFYMNSKNKADHKKAFIWYKKALKHSPTSSMVNNQLGYLYYKGKGVKKNLKKSHQYFLAGAKLDDFVPMGWVVSNYIFGDGGTPKSKSKASYWLKKIKKLAKSKKRKDSVKRYQRDFDRAFK